MTKTLIIVDSEDFLIDSLDAEVVTFENYLTKYPKKNEPKTRIINLCDTEHYLSRGYYCSLLAEARQHKSLPSVSTINDLRDLTTGTDAILTPPAELVEALTEGETWTEYLFFGLLERSGWKRYARKLFDHYPAPILQLTVTRTEGQVHVQLRRSAFAQLNSEVREAFLQRLQVFIANVWRKPASQKRLRWDMAILVNPEETHPPSDKDAIKKFIKAAAKVGIHAEEITAKQAGLISQYDALFIRETTAIDHHTYRLARKAEQEGLVVIDDPTSILRCCNKAFLHDAFSYNGVPAPKTRTLISCDEAELDEVERQFEYPLVLKMPEGSFSRGVYKVKDREELTLRLQELFGESALVLAQEYLYTDFDWRVGVLNGRAIYACRYHMARNHWQIYNHDSKRFSSGNFDTLPTFEVPKVVLDAALKACNMIGKGLYGVDIKQKDRQVYVIEVNDNPSIDTKVEDLYLGNELYMLIMTEFAQRLEARGRKAQ